MEARQGMMGEQSKQMETERARDRHGSPFFYRLIREMEDTHDRKSHDYASNSNPSGNYHFAGRLAVLFSHSPEDAGFIGRIGEKIYRLANLEREGKVPMNESVEDTERDIAVIATLWMADRRQRRAQLQAQEDATRAAGDRQRHNDEINSWIRVTNTDELMGLREMIQTEIMARKVLGASVKPADSGPHNTKGL